MKLNFITVLITSDSNSESYSDSDRVECMDGSNSNSSELNDSGDQAADSQHGQVAEETVPEFSTFRYVQQRTQSCQKNMCHGITYL